METRILGNVSIHGSVRLAQNEAGFPANPQIGTIIVKDQCIYAYIKIGGLETWYPFASRTNSYVHVQGMPALVWNINHGLGTMDVWSQVKDDSGNIVQALVSAVDADNATISFTTPITGTAVIVAPDTIDVPEVKAVSINVANSAVIIDSSGVRIDGSYALTAANIETYAQAAVQAEANTRAAADTTLQNNINAEATARANADTAIQSTISNNIDQSVKTTATPQFAGLKLTGHVLPDTDIAFDLGSVNKRFRDLYLSGSTIHLGDGKISYNATTNTFDLLNPQSAPAKTSLGANTTDDLAEGSNRLYFTTARAQALIDVEANARQSADAALQTLINGKQDALGFTPENIANRGVANGYASLGSDGKVPATQLPSYVDDVLEYASSTGFPATGETSKIYIALNTNKIYRWSGTTYIEISPTAGNSDTATKLAAPVKINGVSFDGSADITITDSTKLPLTGGTLTGAIAFAASQTWPVFNQNTTGNAATATKLAASRTISASGDAVWSVTFDGSSDVTANLTLSNSGITAGTYNNSATAVTPLTVDAKGRVTSAGSAVTITPAWSNITSKPTTLSGYGITDAQAADADLTAIAGLSGTTGLLKKTAANTWSLDTNTYLTANQSITVSGDVSGTGSTAISLTLASITDSGTGSFKKISVDGKGRVTGTAAVTASDITGLSGLLSSTAGSALASSGSSGSSTTIARADHVHPYPTPANIGAQSSSAILTSITGLSTSATGLIKLTAGTASLDTNTYLTANQSITVSGDASGTGSTAIALTLANSGVVAGTYNNSATAVTPLIVDAKGRITSTGSAVTITPAWANITGKPTTLSGYGITDAQAADADLTAIAGLSGNTGFLKKTAANTWALDTNTYLTANQSITVSGDASGAGSTTIALTLANSGVVAGTYNNSTTAITPLTIDAKGRVTGTGTAVTITPAWASITGKPTTLSGYGITDAATINSPEFTGTPVAPTASAGTNTTQIATTAFVSTAVTTADNALQTLINGKQDSLGFTPENSANRGVANGYAALGSDGKVPTAQLPSYVDDVLEYTSLNGFPATGETSKIYIALDTNKIYRWSGTTYIEISPTAGNSDTATKLLTQRTISASGDGTWSVTFDGSSDVTANLTLSNSGITAGTYNNSTTAITPLTIDAKGRVTSAGSSVTITPAWASITGKPTTLSGYGITDAQAADADLTAIAGLSGTTGLLKKTAANTWSLDTNTYLTANQSITVSGDVSGTGSTTIALTLANSGVVAGTYNNSTTAITPLTVDAKGRVTSAGSAVTITPAWASITGKPTTLSGYGITDAATINSPEFTGTPTAPTASAGTNTTQIATTAFVSTAVTAATTSGITSYANGDISSATLTTSTITSGQVVDQNAATTYRSVKYTVQVKSGTAYQLSELLVLHDGTNAYITEFGNIQTGSTLAVFDADIFGGNLRLLVTPVNAVTVIKVIKTLIDI